MYDPSKPLPCIDLVADQRLTSKFFSICKTYWLIAKKTFESIKLKQEIEEKKSIDCSKNPSYRTKIIKLIT